MGEPFYANRKAYLKMIGAKLYKLRTAAGLTMLEVATRTGIAPATYMCYEKGDYQMTMINVASLVYFFGIDFNDLLMPGDIDFIEKIINENKERRKTK